MWVLGLPIIGFIAAATLIINIWGATESNTVPNMHFIGTVPDGTFYSLSGNCPTGKAGDFCTKPLDKGPITSQEGGTYMMLCNALPPFLGKSCSLIPWGN